MTTTMTTEMIEITIVVAYQVTKTRTIIGMVMLVTKGITIVPSHKQGHTGLGVAVLQACGPGRLPTDEHAAHLGLEVW